VRNPAGVPTLSVVDIRVIDPHDEVLLRRHWEIGKAAEAVSRPYDFYGSWESTCLSLTQQRDDLERVLLGAFVDEVMWGAALVEHPLHDNLHSAKATYYVHPERQRQHVGRALAVASYDVARRRSRRLMVTEAFAPVDDISPGLLFAEAMGFSQALVDGMKVVELPATEHLWDALAERAAARHPDYRIVTWQDQVPEQYVAGYCTLNEMFVDEAPMGELDVERERWDAERVHHCETRNQKTGRHLVAAGAVSQDGTLVGVTEIVVSSYAPSHGFQSGTLVAPGHRGHALGLAMKVANHRRLRARFPRCLILMTGNADVNAAMNAVNEALGYREVERCIEMQRPI
jgi:GNAT superfamily N-acetyltransferase